MAAQPNQMLRNLFVLACTICVFLIGLSFLGRFGITLPGPDWQFNLGNENNIAAWWSGVLLALIALCACDGASRTESKKAGTAGAWAALAAVFLFLSADEVGSLHERISIAGEADGTGRWLYLMILGAVLGTVSLWALWRLWRAGGNERRRSIWLTVGFAMLAAVVLQEAIEHSRTWDAPLLNALRLTLEEGTELGAMLLLLWVTLGHSSAALSASATTGTSVFTVVSTHTNRLLLGAALLAPFAVFYSAGHTDGSGQIAKWLAAMLFLAAAAVPIQRIVSRTATRRHWVAAVFCIVASMISVAIDILGKAQFAGNETGAKDVYLLLCVLPLALAWVRSGGALGIVMSLGLLSVALVTVLVPHTAITAFAMPIALGWMVFLGQAKHVHPVTLPAAAPTAMRHTR